MQARKSILFVDDEPKLLDGLKRMLFRDGDRWEMEFAASGAEALRMLAATSFDVIIADMRMPGMNGMELLKEVARLHPQTLRMILSGTWEQDLRLQAAMIAHQYFSKPCNPEVLKSVLERAFALREVLVDPVMRALIASTSSLPSTPGVYQELLRVLQEPGAPPQQIVATLVRDMGMTAKILQLVNSAFFGRYPHTSSLEEAVTRLGGDMIRALALETTTFSSRSVSSCAQFSIEHLQRHSNLVANIAREIAKSRNVSGRALDDIFVAGLLHDVGRLVLAAHDTGQYDRVLSIVKAGTRNISEAEREVFGATHGEAGGYLLWLWNLPDSVVEAVAFHHDPFRSPGRSFGPITAVHVANVLAEMHPDGTEAVGNELDGAYCAEIGVSAEELAAWKDVARRCVIMEPTE